MSLSLADAIFWIAVACCAIAQWIILRGTLAAPVTPAAGTAVPASRRRAELVWAVVPAIALTLVLVATWRAIHASPASAPVPAPARTTAAAPP